MGRQASRSEKQKSRTLDIHAIRKNLSVPAQAISLITRMAALYTAAPITEPAGWQAALAVYNP